MSALMDDIRGARNLGDSISLVVVNYTSFLLNFKGEGFDFRKALAGEID